MQFQHLSPCGALGLRAWRRRRWAALGKYAWKGGRSQTGVLLGGLLWLAALLAACGGGEALEAVGTPAGERAERAGQTTTVAQGEAQQDRDEQGEAAQGREVPSGPVNVDTAERAEAEAAAGEGESQTAVEAEVEDESGETITFEEELVERVAAALAAHRAGLAVERNVLGDPNAPVLVVEYGDFQ